MLSRPGVASVVTPIHSEEQLDEFARAIDLPPLSDDDLARIEALIESDFQPEPEAEAGDTEPGEADAADAEAVGATAAA